MRGKLFGSLDACTRSRLLWHIFTFPDGLDCSFTRGGTPRSQLCIWTLRTRSKKDKSEALRIAGRSHRVSGWHPKGMTFSAWPQGVP
jgi:hypothetical protein